MVKALLSAAVGIKQKAVNGARWGGWPAVGRPNLAVWPTTGMSAGVTASAMGKLPERQKRGLQVKGTADADQSSGGIGAEIDADPAIYDHPC